MAGKKLTQPKVTIEQIEKALRDSGGFISRAAKMLNLGHSAVSQRVSKSEYLQTVLKEIKEGYLDLAETTLLKKIKNEDTTSTLFYLKCQGKGRGYIEKQEVEVQGSKDRPLKIERVIIKNDQD